MDLNVDWFRVFQTVSLLLFVALMLLAASRMVLRWVAFRQNGLKAPYLLRRDIVLMGTFSVYFGLVLIFRLFGIVLTQNPFWVIPSTLAGLIAMGYWVWVEFHLEK